MSKSYEDLRVWQKSIELAKAVYGATKSFPKEEIYGLTSQIRRSAVSVPSNIAEGCARHSQREFLQFLGVASGSVAELHTQLILANEFGFLNPEEREKLITQAIDIGKMLTGLKASIKEQNIAIISSNERLETSNAL